MRILLVALALALGAALAGTARAQTPIAVTEPLGLPSHEQPNAPGAIAYPAALSTPPAVPEHRSYEQLLGLWRQAGEAYGVPWQVLAAINRIESNFGSNMGPSSAGAVGWMQFIPSTWEMWGTDANGDGVADPWNPEDAIFSAARYLAAAGAHEDLYRGIFAYNHADWYVRDVLELAQVFSGGAPLGVALPYSGFGAQLVFNVEDMGERLARARRSVVRAKRALSRIEAEADRLEWASLAAEQEAGNPDLAETEFRELESRVSELAAENAAAHERLARGQKRLQTAVAVLEALRSRASAVTFWRTLSGAFAGPQFQGGYVFPVGGGAEVVSVGHDHHDYPAADIAAPEGSPLYALANGVVVDTYPTPAGLCGIGFSIQVESGARYVYCHLSYLEPSVVPGVALAAGAPVGLVGSTGHSTGPHLHLGLVPSVAYPQDEPWFESFAGVAFTWQDEPRADSPVRMLASVDDSVAAPEPVFTVVEPVVTFTR